MPEKISERGTSLLRVQISDGSSDDAGHVGGAIDGDLGETEVGDLGSHVLVQQYVAALQIPVYHRWRAPSVKVLYPCGTLTIKCPKSVYKRDIFTQWREATDLVPRLQRVQAV